MGSSIPPHQRAFHIDHEEEFGAGQFGRKVGVVEGPDAIVDDKVGEVVLVVV